MCRYSKIWIIRAGCPCVKGDRDLPWNVLWQSKVLFFSVSNTKSSDTHLKFLPNALLRNYSFMHNLLTELRSVRNIRFGRLRALVFENATKRSLVN